VGAQVALQGNLDPNVLFAPPEVIAREARKILAAFYAEGFSTENGVENRTGLVFNLGHGISQFTPPEHVHALVETVHAGAA
jgi:uroporphyrinogen decarboxylase